MSGHNQHPQTLTLQQKAAIFQAAETESFETIMERFKLKRSTCYDILKSKNKVLNVSILERILTFFITGP
jgi:hypothetical protein